MSFFVIAAVLAWSAIEALQANAAIWRVAIDLFAAAAAISLGVLGRKKEHQ